MSQLRLINSTFLLLSIFFIQETLISRINFPWHSFSLYLAVVLVLISFEDRNGALIFSFIGGFILDISPSAETPFGQWALAMTITGYIFSINRDIIGDFTFRPIAYVLLISVTSGITFIIFLFLGLLLGQDNGGFTFNLGVIAANVIWTLLILPIFIPIIIRVRKLILSSREKL